MRQKEKNEVDTKNKTPAQRPGLCLHRELRDQAAAFRHPRRPLPAMIRPERPAPTTGSRTAAAKLIEDGSF